MGGFLDERNRSYFWSRHVAFCAETFGDLVFGWKPINEPNHYAGIYAQAGRQPADRNWDTVFALYGATLLAQRDAWRELRGAGKPVATIHGLGPVRPVDESEAAGAWAATLEALWPNVVVLHFLEIYRRVEAEVEVLVAVQRHPRQAAPALSPAPP